MLVGGQIAGPAYEQFHTPPPATVKHYLLQHATGIMSYCPSCGCGVLFHREVYRIGDERIARCENCGRRWRSANTEFLARSLDLAVRLSPRCLW